MIKFAFNLTQFNIYTYRRNQALKDLYFAENLKRFREEKELTKEELGSRIGVTGATIGLWESKKNEPRMGKVQTIAEVLNVGLGELLFSEPPSVNSLTSLQGLSELKQRGVKAVIEMPESELVYLLPLLERASEQ
ncbi:hypothetical protein B2I21_07345 [Chryseobacterium mucoviscidosis]|nr:hypothetical protein B2I21_07345 [Chryseobacterium mucoviscidosis]